MVSMTGVAAFSAILLSIALLSPESLNAQGRSDRARAQATIEGRAGDANFSVTFSVGEREEIGVYYASAPTRSRSVEALPPGIRKNLARGKPLPPGIAKKQPPSELVSRLSVPRGYEVVEVGLDVLLVEAATGIIHDVLMDVVR